MPFLFFIVLEPTFKETNFLLYEKFFSLGVDQILKVLF